MAATREPIISWCSYEARTYDGQLMRFWGPSDMSPRQLGQIRGVLGRTKEYKVPETHTVNVGHGGYGQYSRYDIEQTKYAGGGGGYIEAVHVRDAPDGRCAHLVYRYTICGNSRFFEFETQDAANAAWEKCGGKHHRIDEALREQPGFMREVFCDVMTPWFYAVGNQELVGDWAFPEHTQDHPYFTPGALYSVRDADSGNEQVKRCIGSRVVDNSAYPVDTILVFWDDGTYFSSKTKNGLLHHEVPLPRALREDSEEVGRALGEFRALLAADPKLAKQFLGDLRHYHDASPAIF